MPLLMIVGMGFVYNFVDCVAEPKEKRVINALILLGCDTGRYQDKRSKNEEISCVLRIGMRKIDRVKKRFVENDPT